MALRAGLCEEGAAETNKLVRAFRQSFVGDAVVRLAGREEAA